MKKRHRGWLKSFRRRIAFSGIFSDTLSNVLAGLLLVLFGGILLTNSTYQFALFTTVRNAFVDDKQAYCRMADIRGIAIDDEVIQILDENKETLKGGIYDALAEALQTLCVYAKDFPNRTVVAGVDFVFEGVDDRKSLDGLVKTLSSLPPNLIVVLGAAINEAGTETSYFRFDHYRDHLLKRVRAASGGRATADQQIYIGNLHLMQGNVVSGFQQLENLNIALGYVPVIAPSSVAPVLYYSLPFLMYMLGEIVPEQARAQGLFQMSADGYLSGESPVDRWPVPQKSAALVGFMNRQFRYNFFSKNDLSDHSLLRMNYFPLGKLSHKFSTSGQPVTSLSQLVDQRKFGLEVQGVLKAPQAKADYFFIYRPKSLGYLRDGASTDVVVTPASGRDPFTDDLETVSGAMAHMTALANLLNQESILTVPFWLEPLLAGILGLLALIVGLRCEFRTIVLTSSAVFLGLLALGYGLFLGNLFFSCRWPMIVPLGILTILGASRFLVTKEGRE